MHSDELGQMSRDMQPVPKSRQSVFSSVPKCPHSIFLGRKAMTNLGSILKSRMGQSSEFFFFTIPHSSFLYSRKVMSPVMLQDFRCEVLIFARL